MTHSAGIIAAGEGSRFKKSGIMIHKPMIPVAGFPLIGHTLRRLESLGVIRVVIIFNELEKECLKWVRENFPRIQTEFIVKSTESSFESFWMVGRKLGRGRHLISTVDSFCAIRDVKKMLQSDGASKKNVYLGITSFSDDEKPVLVEMNRRTHRIKTLGERPDDKIAPLVTAGFYNVPDSIFRSRPKENFSSLRMFLKWLVQNGTPVYGVLLSKVVDVDLPKDIRCAEAMLTPLEKDPTSVGGGIF